MDEITNGFITLNAKSYFGTTRTETLEWRMEEERQRRGNGGFIYDVRTRGGRGSPESRQKEQNQLISVRDKEGKGQKSQNFADVIYGIPLMVNGYWSGTLSLLLSS